MRDSKGFTLIEIIVAVALVAILSAAVAPSVLNNISQGRIARAQSDVQAIASAIMRFKADTGVFPRLPSPKSPDTGINKIRFLASDSGSALPAALTAAKWPSTGGYTSATGAAASFEGMNNHLVLGINTNGTTATDSYPRVPSTKRDDPNAVGFRGGLLSSVTDDPWGKAYLCNVYALDYPGEACWVISAGPNGVVETAVATTGTGAATTLVNDDVGFRVQ
ncbi:MAG: prepilin-type N-terminal cleavage/methylation domain-containing protein [Candidatus Glassbacteria bacterium]